MRVDGVSDVAGRAEELRAVCVEELSRILNMNPAEFDGLRSFDDYGLDSIDALVALGAISDRLGLDLPPELLFVHRTLDAAVQAMAGGAPQDDPAARSAHLFWFPGGGILDEPLVINFRARVSDVAAFEIIHVGSWGRWRDDASTLDDLVAAALAQVEAAAPSGPLLFLGDSQGGQLAYATALASVAADREVAGLVLFDTAPDYPLVSTSIPAALARLVDEWGALVRAPGKRSLTDYRRFAAWHAFQMMLAVLSPKHLLALARRTKLGLFSHPRVDRQLQALAFGTLWAAWPRAKRMPLDCPAVLLRSNEPGPEDFGWGATLPRLAIHRVPGGHRTMFSADHAPVLHQTFVQSLATLIGRQKLDPS